MMAAGADVPSSGRSLQANKDDAETTNNADNALKASFMNRSPFGESRPGADGAARKNGSSQLALMKKTYPG
jgi:hypothetical protein